MAQKTKYISQTVDDLVLYQEIKIDKFQSSLIYTKMSKNIKENTSKFQVDEQSEMLHRFQS